MAESVKSSQFIASVCVSEKRCNICTAADQVLKYSLNFSSGCAVRKLLQLMQMCLFLFFGGLFVHYINKMSLTFGHFDQCITISITGAIIVLQYMILVHYSLDWDVI